MNVRLYQKRKKGRPATKLKKEIVTSGGTQVKLSRRNFPIKVKVKSGGTPVKPKKLGKVIVTSGGTQVKVERRGQRNIYRRQIRSNLKSNVVESSTSDRRIKRDAGGRNKNPVAKKLRTPMFKPKVKPSERLYIKFSRKGKKESQ